MQQRKEYLKKDMKKEEKEEKGTFLQAIRIAMAVEPQRFSVEGED